MIKKVVRKVATGDARGSAARKTRSNAKSGAERMFEESDESDGK